MLNALDKILIKVMIIFQDFLLNKETVRNLMFNVRYHLVRVVRVTNDMKYRNGASDSSYCDSLFGILRMLEKTQ